MREHMIIIKDARGEMIGIACQRWPREKDDAADGDEFVIPAYLNQRPVSEGVGSDSPAQDAQRREDA